MEEQGRKLYHLAGFFFRELFPVGDPKRNMRRSSASDRMEGFFVY